MRAVSEGRGGVVLIEGPPGIGKTRQLARATSDAASAGVVVADAPPDLRPAGLDLGDGPGLDTPRVVALDDLEHASEPTLATIQELALDLAARPVLWVLSGQRRPGSSLDHTVSSLEVALGATRITLTPLPPDAVAQVVADVLDARPDDALLAMVDGAGGNPLLVVELVTSLRQEAAIAVSGGVARLLSDRVPRRVEAIVACRMGALSPATVRLLEVAAVLGPSFAADDLAAVLAEPVGRLLGSLHEALDAGLLSGLADDALAFRHELVRMTVYAGLPEPVRVALHHEIGARLLERKPSAAAAAAHLIHGARPGDLDVLAGLDRALPELRASAPDAAADLALHALALTEPTDAERVDRTVAAVEALVAARRADEALALARGALALPGAEPAVAARLHLTVASINFVDGRADVATAEAEAVLHQLGLPDELYAAADTVRLLGLLGQSDPTDAREAAEAVLGGERAGGDQALAGALTALALIAWQEGRLADAIGLARAGARRSSSGTGTSPRGYPGLMLAGMLTAVDRFDEADDVLASTSATVEQRAETTWAMGPSARRAHLALAAGRWDAAVSEARLGLAEAEALGGFLFVPGMRAVLAVADLAKGALRQASEHVRRGQAAAGHHGVFAPVVLALAAAQVVGAIEGPDQAMGQLAPTYDDQRELRPLLASDPGAAPWLTRTALAAGDRRRAVRIAACAERLVLDNRSFSAVRAAANHAVAVLNQDPGSLIEAADSHRRPWLRASALEDAGVASKTQGPLEQALAGYEQLGAARDASRVRARLRRLGVRRRHWAREDRPVTGWASLTATERKVTALVAEGLTNALVADRMFLSRHTVDFHLRQIFRKLGIGSRVELTRMALGASSD